MSSVKDYNVFYRLAYEFHARWFPYPANTLNWEKCLDDMRSVAVQNGNNPFLQDVLMNVVDEMQRVYAKELSTT